MWLTRLALKNPVFILMMSLMVIVLGWVSVNRLSVDLFPDITIPVVRVATFYTGAGPVDIEKSITQPVERAVAASPGVDRVESQSKQGVSLVSVWFQFGDELGQRPIRGFPARSPDTQYIAAGDHTDKGEGNQQIMHHVSLLARLV